MAKKIVLADSFIDSRDQLSRKERKTTKKSLEKFYKEEKTNSFQIHKLKRIKCDDSFRSARVNSDLRFIISLQGKSYIFLYVDHHEEAYNWAENKYLNKNSYGGVYVYNDNINLIEKKNDDLIEDINQFYDTRSSLFEDQNINSKDLVKLDIKKIHAEYLMKIKDEDKFMEFISLFPEEIQEGLIDIVTGTKNITQVYNELMDDSISNTDSIANALNHKDSKRRFYTVDDLDELNQILDEGMEKWKLFLHPKQETLVKKDYNGPALIEGGPGTGKTVVGIHRSVFLSKNVYSSKDGNKILFCTFSKKLASYIEKKIYQLAKQKNVNNNIEVFGVDSLIYKIEKNNNLTNKKITINEIDKLFVEVYKQLKNKKWPLDFYKTEYKEVIQRYDINSLDSYLELDRYGRGKGLLPSSRKKVWNFFEKFLKRKKEKELIDFEDLAHIVHKEIKKGNISPIYDSIIVDEAQDLTPVKLKVLSKLVKTKENNLMLLSDSNQRIYQINSWKSEIDINIVGRTSYLTLNYRTTKQIRKYADSNFIQSQLKGDYIKEYKSLFSGPEPLVEDFKDKKTQYENIKNKIEKLNDNGVEYYEICIMTATKDECKKIVGILEDYGGIPCTILDNKVYPEPGNGVGISTLHGSKGLEFKTVIIANYFEISERLKGNITDEYYNKNKIKQIECLKYVACTRAREELIITYVNE